MSARCPTESGKVLRQLLANATIAASRGGSDGCDEHREMSNFGCRPVNPFTVTERALHRYGRTSDRMVHSLLPANGHDESRAGEPTGLAAQATRTTTGIFASFPKISPRRRIGHQS